MKAVYAMWWGGDSYAQPDQFDERDVECFPSIKSAAAEFERRFHSSYYPCVSDNAEMWLFLGESPLQCGDIYPDRIVKRGPRGGIKVERA